MKISDLRFGGSKFHLRSSNARPAGLLAEYLCLDGSGTTLSDSSGNGNHGTLGFEGSELPTWSATGLTTPGKVTLPAALGQQALTVVLAGTFAGSASAYRNLYGPSGSYDGIYLLNGSRTVASGLGGPEGVRRINGDGRYVLVSVAGATPRLYINGSEEPAYAFRPSYAPGATSVLWLMAAANAMGSGELSYAALWGPLTHAESLSESARTTGLMAERDASIDGTTTLPRVVFEGDSRTRGNDYPLQTMLPLTDAYVRVGVNGSGSAEIAAGSRTTPCFLRSGADEVAVLWIGGNDWASGTLATVTQANVQAWCGVVRGMGRKAVICTDIDRNGLFSGGATQSSYRTQRDIFNTWARDEWESIADGIIDLAADSRLMDADNEEVFLPGTDKTHLTSTGSGYVAEDSRPVLTGMGVV